MRISTGHDGGETRHYRTVRQEYSTVAARMKSEEGVSIMLHSMPFALHAISRESGTLVSLVVLPRRVILDSQSVQTAPPSILNKNNQIIHNFSLVRILMKGFTIRDDTNVYF